MNSSVCSDAFSLINNQRVETTMQICNLSEANTNHEYVIKNVIPEDQELVDFLFSLGCYPGEKITLISELSENFVVSIKDARYSLNRELAELILI